MESYRRTRPKEREIILVLVQNGKKQADIAKALGRNQSSLSRELAKGLERGAYRKSPLKIDAQTWEVIKNHLSLHWPPKQIENFLYTGGNNGTVTAVSEKIIEGYIVSTHIKKYLKHQAVNSVEMYA